MHTFYNFAFNSGVILLLVAPISSLTIRPKLTEFRERNLRSRCP